MSTDREKEYPWLGCYFVTTPWLLSDPLSNRFQTPRADPWVDLQSDPPTPRLGLIPKAYPPGLSH